MRFHRLPAILLIIVLALTPVLGFGQTQTLIGDPSAQSPMTEKELLDLYRNVKPFKIPYAASPTHAIGPNALTILAGGDSVGVVARYKKGKIAVIGHEDFLNESYLSRSPNAKQFMIHLRAWLKAGSTQPLIIANPYMTQAEALKLEKTLASGGSVLLAYKGWVLDYSPEDRVKQLKPMPTKLRDYPVQSLLNTAGIALTGMNEWLENTSAQPDLKAFETYSLDSLWRQLEGTYNPNEDDYPKALRNEEAGNQTSVYEKIKAILKAVHPGTSAGRRLKQLTSDKDWLAVDTAYKLQSSVLRDTALLSPLSLAANQKAHPKANQFPGATQPTAAKVTRVVTVPLAPLLDKSRRIYCTPESWVSTGLYAPPGVNVTVTVPDGVTTVAVQIGAHRDTLNFNNTLKRMPLVTGQQVLSPGKQVVSSPFGGLIYLLPVETERSGKVFGKTASITLSGGIEAPFYELGKTNVADWLKQVKAANAPWTELSGNRVILTVPTVYAQAVTDPEALMKTWDEIVSLEETLAGFAPGNTMPHKSVSVPWRVVTDLQLQVGFMYAGYPIMAHSVDSAANLLNVDALKHMEWGVWHELGHNYQMPAMTWSDMGEVTNNIFSLYVQAHYGNPSWLDVKADDTGLTPRDGAKAYLAKPLSERRFGSLDFFERLVLLDDLRAQFGWEFFTKLHRYYREVPGTELPVTDAEKIAFFKKAASKVAGKDLTAWFEAWGL